MKDKPTYQELEKKLQEAEKILETLRNHEVDAVVGSDQVAMMRLQEVEDRLEDQIQISNNRLREIESIYQNVPVGLCILDTDLRFVRVNKYLARLHGIPAEEHMGKTIDELLPKMGEGIEDGLREVLETGESKMDIELCGETPAQPGVERHFLQHWLPLYNQQEQVMGINIVVEEITERKQHEEKLQRRVEERTESLLSYQDQLRSLASQLSKAEEQERHRLATELHDNLGQMLAVNKMKIDLLPDDQLSDEIASEIEDIKQGMENALTYTRDLMSDLKPPPSLDKEDVSATISWVAQKMEKHGLEVIVEDDGEPKRASEDIRTTLLQCVREVLFNIIKHAGVNDAFVSLSRSDDHVQILVEDEGRGFDPEANTGSSQEGGFGLFNIQERMDLLGGSVDIESEPGQGTTVKLVAPLKELRESELPGEPDKEEVDLDGANGRKIKVMLADDHQMMRKGLKKIVEAEDDLTVVGEASDGQEAVSLAREVTPDIIVMDVNMPRMNGIDATQKILSIMPKIRVVALSLHDHQNVIESIRSAGATAYLSKSEAFETLCATIRSEADLARK